MSYLSNVKESWFIMRKAYVRSYETNKVRKEKEKGPNMHYDIGVITQSSRIEDTANPNNAKLIDVPFYKKEQLHLSKIAPICLGAVNEKLHACDVTTVGWGTRYTEDPINKLNEFHTCTTNGVLVR